MRTSTLVKPNIKKMSKEKIKIPRHEVFKDFALIRTLSGSFVCPGWHPVPDDTTRDDIELVDNENYTPPVKDPVIVSEPVENLSFIEKSSKGDSTYHITRINGLWNCDCPASTFFKGPCKHIKKFQQETDLKKAV